MILLLSSRRGFTKEELFREIELYGEAPTAAAREKLFDRDKAMLREQGIPVETFNDDALFENDFTAQRYRINAAEYRLPGVTFTPGEAAALTLAAGMWDQAALDSAATRALRRLQGRGVLPGAGDVPPIAPRIRTSEPHWDEVWHATTSHRAISFSYRAASTGREEKRTVQPWGMGTRYGHWYVVGFDVDRGAERFFRLSRITTTPAVVDGAYEVPAGFDMRSALTSLKPVDEPNEAIVRVRSGTCQVLRLRKGAVPGAGEEGWESLRFFYGDPEVAASDIAGSGADARAEHPPELVALVGERVKNAATAMSRSVPQIDFSGAERRPSRRKTSAEQHLGRLLDLVPYLSANPGARLEDTARQFGITRQQLTRDLDLLFVSGPRYYPDGLIDVRLEDDRIFLSNARDLSEPVRLTMDEACTLIVGLETLKSLPGVSGASAVATAHAKLTDAAGEAGRAGAAIAARLTEPEVGAALEVIQQAVNDGVRLHLTYLVPARDEITDRVVEPVRAFSRDDVWYLEAWCTGAQAVRNFRLDRIQAAKPTGEPVQRSREPGDFPEHLFRPSDTDAVLTLLLRPPARWVADHYDAARTVELEDGRLAAEIRVASTAWVPGLLARLGGDAVVAGPEPLRAEAQQWLQKAARNYA